MPSGFRTADWIVLAAYAAVVLVVGALAHRSTRAGRAGDELFLGGRRMPGWAVAISVLATSLSAATFIGGPQQAYAGDLTYLSSNVGMLLAVIVVAVLFLPAYYRLGVTSVYELLGHRYGPVSRRAASAMFMLGRVFASGARLYMVAIPFALVAFGSLEPRALDLSIILIAVVAAAYTMLGGIRAVIWTDVIQAAIVVGTVAFALVVLLDRIPLETGAIADALRESGKLTVVDLSTDPRRSYTVWTALIGFTLFGIAAFGTDQDLTQRMLTCRSARVGAWSTVASNLLSWPIVALFLVIGLLLWILYERPDLTGLALGSNPDTRQVFLRFVLEEMPTGARGLMIAGLFAAAMSSLDSALGAMASTTVADFVRPLRKGDTSPNGTPPGEGMIARIAIGAWAVVLAAFALVCVRWQQASDATLIDFALGVMVFAYGGLLGVFLCALLTRRGSDASAVAALAAGAIVVVLLRLTELAFPWQMTAATLVSFGVCAIHAGRRPDRMRSSAASSVASSLQNAKRTSDAPSDGS